MSDTFEASGSCLCGGVHIGVKTMSKELGACHCTMCRHWGGGPLMTVDCGTEVSFQDEENISVFDSSDWAERGFCNKCGSHLFYRLKENQQYIMPVGLFEAGDLVFDHQVFIDHKPSYYSFANDTENMTGAEMFAKFAPPSA